MEVRTHASFDSELALIDSAQYSPAIHANYWISMRMDHGLIQG